MKIDPPIRILMAKPGLDGHDRGIKVLAAAYRVGVNPIEKFMDNMGEMALRLIVLTLFISSLSEFKKFRFLIEVRRMIGLFAFFYVSCHFLTYIALDHFFDMTFIIKDIDRKASCRERV